MEYLTKFKLQDLIPVVYNHLKETKPNAGVIDFASVCGEVINYMEASRYINSNEKQECIAYTAYLISEAFPNGLPSFVVNQVRNTISNVSGYSKIAPLLYSRC